MKINNKAKEDDRMLLQTCTAVWGGDVDTMSKIQAFEMQIQPENVGELLGGFKSEL